MPRFRGLTWDHPRGRVALERSARGLVDAAGEALIDWDVHSLEGFESGSIAELAERYDVIVLDHPHLGDALAAGSLQPLDALFAGDWLDRLGAATIGPSLRSYRLDGHTWALPLDAATQVSARLPERVEVAPETWAEVLELSARQPVALSLAGPHAFLTFASLCVALGEEPSVRPGEPFVSERTGAEAGRMLADLAARMPDDTAGLNPIALLERMRGRRDIAYIPLVYGYVNYSMGDRATALRFGNAPSIAPGGRRGSTIGGTGLALSARTEATADLADYLRWLMNPVTQATYIPDNAGQPGSRSAWLNPSVNAAAADFYRATAATIDDAWIRPRFAGFTALQARASAVLRAALLGPDNGPDNGPENIDAAVAAVNDLFHRADARPHLTESSPR